MSVETITVEVRRTGPGDMDWEIVPDKEGHNKRKVRKLAEIMFKLRSVSEDDGFPTAPLPEHYKGPRPDCPRCGSPWPMENVQPLNIRIVSALRDIGRVSESDFVYLTNFMNSGQWGWSTRNNVTKAQYWGLLAPKIKEDGTFAESWWGLTDLCLRFLRGVVAVPAKVVTVDGRVIRTEGDSILVHQIEREVKRRAEYAADAKLHKPERLDGEELPLGI